jgi:hypothetical protein
MVNATATAADILARFEHALRKAHVDGHELARLEVIALFGRLMLRYHGALAMPVAERTAIICVLERTIGALNRAVPGADLATLEIP